MFNVDLEDGQWMGIEGEGGNDTFNIEPGGEFLLAYWYAPAGVEVDLGSGRASNDGHGDVDVINGHPWGVAGTLFADTLRGSDRNETFYGRGGNDTIVGGGGTDALRFSPGRFRTVGDLQVDLEAGTATGTWEGAPFTYTLSGIESVHGHAGNDTLLGDDGENRLSGGAGDDVINPRGVAAGGTDTVGGSAGNDRIVYSDSGNDTYQWLYYSGLDIGRIRVTIDGGANRATVDKGAAGTDTLVDVAVPMEAWGFGIDGTRHDDTFRVDLEPGQWMEVDGGAGDDTFVIQPGGTFAVGFYGAQQGVVVDLAAGRATDGYGDADTYLGDVLEVAGTTFADVIRGSGNDETFVGRGGDDTIDGRGGFDTLRFNRSERQTRLDIDLGSGVVTGSQKGTTFTYTISNIEGVQGGDVGDTFRGSSRDERFRGRSGADQFVFGTGHGDDIIEDFADGQDTLVIRGLGISKSQVLSAASDNGDGGTRIDLRPHDGGTIDLWDFSIGSLDESDILL